jgi:DNA-binding Lrp family transcriptional regulator
MEVLDEMDKAILNRIQSNFPISRHPFQDIAEDVGMTEEEIIKRISSLKEMGIIRRIGGNFVPEKLGFVSTLCAARVPEDKVEQFAFVVNEFAGVTHNYERDAIYNVWFTFIASSHDEINRHLKIIREKTGIYDLINLPATRVFKIRAHFDID